jgi:hypothetical protein
MKALYVLYSRSDLTAWNHFHPMYDALYYQRWILFQNRKATSKSIVIIINYNSKLAIGSPLYLKVHFVSNIFHYWVIKNVK